MTITNATTEMASSYFTIATNYDQKPAPLRQQNYKTQKLTDEDNERINEIFDEFEEDEEKLYTNIKSIELENTLNAIVMI